MTTLSLIADADKIDARMAQFADLGEKFYKAHNFTAINKMNAKRSEFCAELRRPALAEDGGLRIAYMSILRDITGTVDYFDQFGEGFGLGYIRMSNCNLTQIQELASLVAQFPEFKPFAPMHAPKYPLDDESGSEIVLTSGQRYFTYDVNGIKAVVEIYHEVTENFTDHVSLAIVDLYGSKLSKADMIERYGCYPFGK